MLHKDFSQVSAMGDVDTLSQDPQYTFFLNFAQTKIGEAFLVTVQRPGMAGNVVAPKFHSGSLSIRNHGEFSEKQWEVSHPPSQ